MPERGPARAGTVYLVGWGPGDAGLATVRAHRLSLDADLTVADSVLAATLAAAATAPRRLLDSGSPSAFDQAVKVAAGGGVVAWLFAGDPFLEGPGHHLAARLLARGVAVEAVPGLPRMLASAVQAGADMQAPLLLAAAEPVPAPAAGSVLLPLTEPPTALAERLLERGWPAATASLLVQGAGGPGQVSSRQSLQELARSGGGQVPPQPAVLALGAAAGPGVAGFEARPLHGRTVALTRPPEQAGEMAAWLREAGARVLLWPTIDIEAVTESEDIDRAVADLARHAWVIFTSVNGVRCFFHHLRRLGRDARAFGAARVAAIGPATGDAVAGYGLRPDLVPARYQAEGLLDALQEQDLDGQRILIPRAEKARDILPETLRRRGAEVEVLVVYRAVAPALDAAVMRRELLSGRVDAVTFTSSSTVTQFAERLGAREAPALLERGGAAVACIGPITAATARELGFKVAVEPGSFTVPDLVAALARHFGSA